MEGQKRFNGENKQESPMFHNLDEAALLLLQGLNEQVTNKRGCNPFAFIVVKKTIDKGINQLSNNQRPIDAARVAYYALIPLADKLEEKRTSHYLPDESTMEPKPPFPTDTLLYKKTLFLAIITHFLLNKTTLTEPRMSKKEEEKIEEMKEEVRKAVREINIKIHPNRLLEMLNELTSDILVLEGKILE